MWTCSLSLWFLQLVNPSVLAKAYLTILYYIFPKVIVVVSSSVEVSDLHFIGNFSSSWSLCHICCFTLKAPRRLKKPGCRNGRKQEQRSWRVEKQKDDKVREAGSLLVQSNKWCLEKSQSGRGWQLWIVCVHVCSQRSVFECAYHASLCVSQTQQICCIFLTSM